MAWKPNDYLADRELTVTITLSEYRELVEFKGKYEGELSKLRTQLYESDSKIRNLTNRIAEISEKCED